MNNFFALRIYLGLTQSELASKIGVSTSAISGWEKGTSRPSLDTLLRLSELSGFTINDILSFQLEPIQSSCVNKSKTVWNIEN